MRKRHTIAAFLIGFSLVFGPSALAQRIDAPVRMKDLPKAVSNTVRQQSEGAKLLRLFSQTENGQTWYEAELKAQGHIRSVLIDQNGQVIEIEEEVALASLPPGARTTLRQKAGEGRITSVESITRNNVITAYAAHVNTRGKRSEIKVDADGKLISVGSTSLVVR